jgi:hypothetical protein
MNDQTTTATTADDRYAFAQTDAAIAEARAALRAARDLYYAADDHYAAARDHYEDTGRDDDHRDLVTAGSELRRAELAMHLCETMLEEAKCDAARVRASSMMQQALNMDAVAEHDDQVKQANRALVLALAQYTRATEACEVAARRVSAAWAALAAHDLGTGAA